MSARPAVPPYRVGMASRLLSVTFDVADPARAATFWGGMLDRDVVETDGVLLLRGDQVQLGLAFTALRTAKSGPNRMHLHLTSSSWADQEQIVARALGLGASHLDVRQLPEEEHVVLADPEGNEFCVIEPGNAFLAGCGFLGELACDGGREVGVFWSAALGWPLVWDQDDETAIQSPGGGTKVAWGGRSESAARPRQRFDLVTVDSDPEDEAARLVALGATRCSGGEDGTVVLADPDGTELRLLTA